jgi:putative zinc finger protein
MNCNQVRQLLPEFTYEDLAPGEMEQVKEHLMQCQTCKGDQGLLQELGQMLNSVSAPSVHVNVPLLFRQANDVHCRQMRQWRRAALAMSGLAAAVLVVLVFRLELRVSVNQMVIGWGSKSSTAEITRDPKSELQPMSVPSSDVVASEAELQPLRALIYEMAANIERVSQDGELRDRRQQQNLARLQDQLTQLRGMFQRYMTTYLADSSKKGDNR